MGTQLPCRSDTRDVKKTLGVIPFRHSKLTEMLMDYFVGDGRAVNTSFAEVCSADLKVLSR